MRISQPSALLGLFLLASATSAQKNTVELYRTADSLLQGDALEQALTAFKELGKTCAPGDSMAEYALWYETICLVELEKTHRAKEEWAKALAYALEAVPVMRRGEPVFGEEYAARRPWMYKNIIVSLYGLNDLKRARAYQDTLYMGYKNGSLPEGLDQYYCFESFKHGDRNIWGYEWYPEIGDPGTEGSFSKIVYYAYSTNPDGTDKDQLFRLHVLKIHKIDPEMKADYVLTKRLETATEEVSGTLWSYTYERPVDMERLRKDIRAVLEGNYQPDAVGRSKKK